MLSNPFSKVLIILVVLAAAFITISFIDRPAPSNAELSWPPRPVIVPASSANDLSDYFLRHPGLTPEPVIAGIPVTGAVDLSDYFMRHPHSIVATPAADTSDYYLRHRE